MLSSFKLVLELKAAQLLQGSRSEFTLNTSENKYVSLDGVDTISWLLNNEQICFYHKNYLKSAQIYEIQVSGRYIPFFP